MALQNNPNILDSTYHIEAEIGSGGGGVVYKAWHTRLQKHVVIKELKRGTELDVETQRNEVEALKNVKSAYLPQVLDFLVEGERVFTVIEFIEGTSLDKLLSAGQVFSQSLVVKWYGQLASALETIHKNNICHRDIKPANIMLMPSGDVCLIDFNAALVSGNDVQIISRSLGYASPEQYEIYEYYRKNSDAPINYGSSSISMAPQPGQRANESQAFDGGTALLFKGQAEAMVPTDHEGTELLQDDLTEIIKNEETELVESTGGRQADNGASYNYAKTTPHQPPTTDEIDWVRSDIYSLGATMYHLLTGIRPSQKASEVAGISKVGKHSEGIVYVVEQSMQISPAARFESAYRLSDAVRNIRKHDKRWKIARTKRMVAAIILPMLFAVFAATMLMGNRIMAQELEARFYSAVHEIRTGEEPQYAFYSAIGMFWDRIDPYWAMAIRLWTDGEIIACREFIEANLGSIAQFQDDPDSAHMFGSIYHILGNTYYLQPGEPNFRMARGNFKIAAQFLIDDPVVYRDLAIAMARTGDVDEAEQVLETARRLNLDSISLSHLQGEISFARREFDNAIENFSRVISETVDGNQRYRAIHTSDEIFRLRNEPERSVELLYRTMSQIPLNRVPEMTDRLADAFVRIGDYEAAIDLFEQLRGSGLPQFTVLQNLVILYHNLGDFDSAAVLLEEMADRFPNDYRVPMRQAFLEADKQLRIDNYRRDYYIFMQHYKDARTLYSENVRAGEADTEMQMLGLMVDELRAGGWLDGMN